MLNVLPFAAPASPVAFIEGNVLTPWLASRACELNTVAVFVSVLFWGWLRGLGIAARRADHGGDQGSR